MLLTGPQRKHFHQILLAAFPTEASLARMVRFGLNENIQAIARGDDLQDTIFRLIEWACTHGQIQNLIASALAENPYYSDLSDFAEDLLINSSYKSTDSLRESTGNASKRILIPQYRIKWSVGKPGCLILLVDQSNSMNDIIYRDYGSSEKGADLVSKLVSDIIETLWYRSSQRARVEVCVIGYNSNEISYSFPKNKSSSSYFVPITDVFDKALGYKEVTKYEVDDDYEEVDDDYESVRMVVVKEPIWINQGRSGNAAMCAGLREAYKVAYDWIDYHPDNYPPVVINLTSGISNDGDPRPLATTLCELGTSDGSLILFNFFLKSNSADIYFPNQLNDLPLDTGGYIARLFSMSSFLPRILIKEANKLNISTKVTHGAKALIVNGDPKNLIALLPFTDTRALDITDRFF